MPVLLPLPKVISPLTYGGAGFSPALISSLIRWWEADYGVWSDTAGTTPATNGGTVARWDDRKSAANATQAGSTKPAYNTSGINSKPSVDFVTSPVNYLDFTTLSLTNFTVFAVMLPTSFAGASYLLGGSAQGFGSGGTAAGGSGAFVFNGTRIRGSTDQTTGVAKLITATNQKVYQSGVNFTSVAGTIFGITNGDLSSLQMSRIGTRSDSTSVNFRGSVSALLVFNEQLSTTNLNGVGAYLATKYGFTWTNIT